MLNQVKLFLVLATATVVFVNARVSQDEPTTINMVATGLQYDKVRFSVKPGETVRIVLTNQDDMEHNLLITTPGSREDIVAKAAKLGADGPKTDYVPQLDAVLGHVKLIAPGETASLTFTAPSQPGVYPYVCTFPGHGYIMYGAMYVGMDMPALKDDPHIPESRRNEGTPAGQQHAEHAGGSGHPYPLNPPYLFRTFLPDTGPDAIGVSLTANISYCWDAGACRLRYAWEGGFLDFTKFWQSYKRYSVQLIGNIFYRDMTHFPLHIGRPDHRPTVKFKGYKLINRYPEFHYTIDGLDVYELILPPDKGIGMVRTFQIPDATQPIWFTFSPEDGVEYACSVGEWQDGKLRLSPTDARKFSIVMTKKGNVKL